jgi:hypothetical protein
MWLFKDVPRHMVVSGSEAWEVVRRLPAQLDAVADRLRRKAALFGVTGADTEVATGDADRAMVQISGRWLCASAHKTDVVPNMETNVVGENGAFRAANYRSRRIS